MGPLPKPSPKNNEAESTNISSKALSGSKGPKLEASKPQFMKHAGVGSLNHLSHFSAKANTAGKSSARIVSAFDLLGVQKTSSGSKSTRDTQGLAALKGLASNQKTAASTVKRNDNFNSGSSQLTQEPPQACEAAAQAFPAPGEYKVEFAGKSYDMANDTDLRDFFLKNLNASGQNSIFRKNYEKLNKIYSAMLK